MKWGYLQLYSFVWNVHSYICILLRNARCSDWNGSKRGHVYKFLRSQGFVSTYDTAYQYTDADAHKVGGFWISILKSVIYLAATMPICTMLVICIN